MSEPAAPHTITSEEPAEESSAEKSSAEDRAAQEALRQGGPLPEHLAVIMDGNGRWARERGRPRAAGHREGVRSVRDITEACAELGLSYLTLYTFSTENWLRPAREVNALMQLLVSTIRRERRTLLKNGVRLRTIGDVGELPDACRRALEDTCEATSGGGRMTLTLALSYSGRWDIVEAVRRVARRARNGDLDPETIDEDLFAQMLSTKGLPDPDLLIRTGGEQRLSNFLLWELAYTEMIITERHWPAFRRAQLYDAVRDFQARNRRYGRIDG